MKSSEYQSDAVAVLIEGEGILLPGLGGFAISTSVGKLLLRPQLVCEEVYITNTATIPSPRTCPAFP